MKKICIINHGLASGGTDAFVINILKNIDREKFTVDLYLAVDSNSEPQYREAEAVNYLNELSGSLYKVGDLGSIKEKLTYPLKLRKLLKENGPYDAIHSNMDLFNGINLCCAKFAGIKKRISHSHTSKSQYEEKTNKHFIVEAYRRFMRFMINSFATVKLGCAQTAIDYLYGKNQKNTQLVYNGIDLSKYMKKDVSPKCEFEFSPTNIITVGNLIDVKNPFFIIDIISELTKIRQDFKFLWIGTGALEYEVRAKINEKNLSDYITLLGRRSDVDKVLKACSVFLMPSFFEGLSIALVEAQATDLTCIVSDTVTDEADCGKCEFLPLEKGAVYWAGVINDYLNSQRKKELDMNLLNRFDENKTVKKLEKIYNK